VIHMSVTLNHTIFIGTQNLQERKSVRRSCHELGQYMAPNCVAWQERPALTVTEIGDEDTSVYLHVQHTCSVQAVYEVEEDLIYPQEYHDPAGTQFELASKGEC
jgi:hypothetical protein